MIALLTGRIVECRPDRVVLDVGGVGYLLHVPLTTYYVLASARSDEPATLQVHTHVREDALTLFGFSTSAEKDAFEDLVAVTGVGPRMAIAVLSGIGAAELRDCVARADTSRLQKIPGVGKKTAERVLLELQHRWDEPRRRGSARRSGAGTEPRPSASDEVVSNRADALSALVNLGYSYDSARRAVDDVVLAQGSRAQAGLEDLLRAALARLSR